MMKTILVIFQLWRKEETNAEEHWQSFISQEMTLLIVDLQELLAQQIIGTHGDYLDVGQLNGLKSMDHVDGLSIHWNDSEVNLHV